MKKILFRFFFILFMLTISPWYILNYIPGISNLFEFYYNAEVWTVSWFNDHIFHIKDTLNENGGGSGDTSFAWAQFYTYLIIALLGCTVWTFIDRKRKGNYRSLDLMLLNLVRFYLALMAFSYGIIKLFMIQMYFPNLSQLATPLGDLLPMRLSWLFIGYSPSYQMFSGMMEILVGILLLNRRTVTLGAIIGVGVFSNVFMLNVSYDVPVKLFAMQLLIYSIFLTARDWRRIVNIVLNKNAEPTTLYDFDLNKKWQRIARIVFKIGFIIAFVVFPMYDSWSRYKEASMISELKPIKTGVYNINTYIKNNDTTSISNEDEMAWKDFIFDKDGMGSINTQDTLFRQHYRRGYFTYKPDTLRQIIVFKKYARDSTNLFELKYKILDEKTIELWGIHKTDSLRFILQRSNRHFQLTERQFHWISESNR